MWRRSATTGLIVDAPCVLQETMGVLSNPEWGTAMFASGHTSRRVASKRTKAASSRPDLVSFPPILVSETNSDIMSGGQG